MNTATITAYFCGDLHESAAAELEEAIMASESFFAEAMEVEENLLLDYARGGLDPSLRARFERGYPVTQGRREKMVFHAALVKHCDEAQAKAKGS